MFKKGDVLLLVGALAAGLLFLALLRGGSAGSTVIVTERGQTVYTGSLAREKTVLLSGNTVIIENGRAYVSEANCKNQICVHSPAISKAGETIICLPNEVTVEVK